QIALAGPGDPVELRLAIALGLAPFALDQSLLLQADESGVEGPLVEGERMIRHLLEPRRQRVGVQRAHGVECAQDDQVEGSLQQRDAFTWHSSGDDSPAFT